MYKSVASVICIYPVAVMIMDVIKTQAQSISALSIPDDAAFPHKDFINHYIGGIILVALKLPLRPNPSV